VRLDRYLFGPAVMAVTLPSLAGTANAARSQVTHLESQGAFAEAFWGANSATTERGTSIDARMQKKRDPGMAVRPDTADLRTSNLSNTEVMGSAEFTINKSQLTSGSAGASGRRPLSVSAIAASRKPIR